MHSYFGGDNLAFIHWAVSSDRWLGAYLRVLIELTDMTPYSVNLGLCQVRRCAKAEVKNVDGKSPLFFAEIDST